VDKLVLASLQQKLINYLVDDDPVVTTKIMNEIEDHGNISRDVRLHIYKNAYQARLKETIDNDHQILGFFLGDDLFDQMVVGYINTYPSDNTSLRHFADKLPFFLANNAPFNNYPIISELAHFERLLMIAFDAADATRFTRDLLSKTPPEQWPDLVFRLHPSVQMAHFHYNSVETWQALKQEQSPEPAKKQPSNWLLWRNNDRLTQFRSLPAQEYKLINMMLTGASFAALCDFLLEEVTEEEASQVALNYLLTWLDDGMLIKQGFVQE
jgi:hypothetical protein